MEEHELLKSLENTAYTSGAGANCFFQGFIHTLCVQEPDVLHAMTNSPGTQTLITVFNQEIPEMRVSNMEELIIVANAMHPLERELIFGPIMRKTLNELHLKGQEPEDKLLKLEQGSIIFPQHAAAFSHTLGFSYDEYTHKDDAEDMPKWLKNDVVGDTFYRVSHPLDEAVGTLTLRLKSCHFEVGGLTQAQVEKHQSQIQAKEILAPAPKRPESKGARYYDSPAPGSECAVSDAQVEFKDAVNQTMSALRNRPGKHQDCFSSEIFKKIKAKFQSQSEKCNPLDNHSISYRL